MMKRFSSGARAGWWHRHRGVPRLRCVQNAFCETFAVEVPVHGMQPVLVLDGQTVLRMAQFHWPRACQCRRPELGPCQSRWAPLTLDAAGGEGHKTFTWQGHSQGTRRPGRRPRPGQRQSGWWREHQPRPGAWQQPRPGAWQQPRPDTARQIARIARLEAPARARTHARAAHAARHSTWI